MSDVGKLYKLKLLYLGFIFHFLSGLFQQWIYVANAVPGTFWALEINWRLKLTKSFLMEITFQKGEKGKIRKGICDIISDVDMSYKYKMKQHNIK